MNNQNIKKTKSILSHLTLMFMLIAIISILITALIMQSFMQETPCALCLLQRACFIAIGYSIMLYLKGFDKYQSFGIALMFIILLEVIGVRQSLLDICPRQGHEWIGTAVLGLHLPIWSFLSGLIFSFGFAINFLLFETDNKISLTGFPLLKKIANMLNILIIMICAISLIAVILQCSFSQCHTYVYKLL